MILVQLILRRLLLFAFWAPISEQVLIKLKKDGKETVLASPSSGKRRLEKQRFLVIGRSYYTYLQGQWSVAGVHDPYALSSEANSGSSFIIDPKKLLNTTGVKRAKKHS